MRCTSSSVVARMRPSCLSGRIGTSTKPSKNACTTSSAGSCQVGSIPCESHNGIIARMRLSEELLHSGTTPCGNLNTLGCSGSCLNSSWSIALSSRIVKSKLRPGRILMISAAFLNSQAGLLLSCRGGDAAAKEICANGAYSEPGKPEALDPGDGNLQPVVFRGHVAPITAAHYWSLAPGGKRLRVLLDDPAPVCSPFLPLAAELSLQISFLLAGF